MRILNDVIEANRNCKKPLEYLSLWYRVLIGFGFTIPLLFLIGFISGIFLFANPVKAGQAAVNSLF